MTGFGSGIGLDHCVRGLSVPESLRTMVLGIRYGTLDDIGNTMEEGARGDGTGWKDCGNVTSGRRNNDGNEVWR